MKISKQFAWAIFMLESNSGAAYFAFLGLGLAAAFAFDFGLDLDF